MSKSDYERNKQFTFNLAKKFALKAFTEDNQTIEEIKETLSHYDLDSQELTDIIDLLRGIDKTR